MKKQLRGIVAFLGLACLYGACSAGSPATSSMSGGAGTGSTMTWTGLTGSGGGGSGTTATTTTTTATTSSGGGMGGAGGGVSTMACSTTFRFVPPAGTVAQNVSVSGEFNSFSNPGVPMTGPDANGAFTAQVPLTPGFYAYKLIVDQSWELDPAERWQKYVGGIANSGVLVADCHLPTLELATNAVARPAAGQGRYTATVSFVPGQGAPHIDPKSVVATLRKDGQKSPITGVTVSAASSSIALTVPNLADGKYTAFVTAKDLAGQSTQDLRLVFWVEESPFEWSDSLIYMAMTDRFVDGDPTNDPPPTTVGGPNEIFITVDPREDYHGGDYAGVTQKINDGTFDQLGVTVLWLSPPYTNPTDAWLASDGVHYTTGYHGYWPIKAREVDPRWGGASALSAMVIAAHAHGIRVLMDSVVQHVHQEHEYLAAHPDWFNTTGCICGTNNCDWTVHRLDCLFTSYMPNIDWTSTEGTQQWEADAIWWLDTFDIDGLRMDAVKQVPDVAVINLSTAIRSEFEASGTQVYMVGETAMGWVDDTLSDNLSQYDLINEYVYDGLNGQFDFVLYYADPLNVFANQSYGMDHLDYWVQASGWEYPLGSIMSPYIGSEDTARFISIASYRGQTAALDPSIPYNQWTNIAGPPPDSETYGRHRLALAWLLGLPGAPLLYYGDEYGEYGGVDPNNRVSWRGASPSLSADEQATLAWVRKVGQARKNLVAMRRGAYVPVYNTDTNVLVFARQDTLGDVALEAISRLDTPTSVTTSLPASLAIPDGTVLHDQMGGPDVPVSHGIITVSLAAQGVAILAP